MRKLAPVVALFLMALFAGLAIPPAYAATIPRISNSASISCVSPASGFTANPCGDSLSVALKVSRGDTILVFTSNYVGGCASPVRVQVGDSIGDSYSVATKAGFQFGACDTTPAYDYQHVYYASAKVTGTLTVKLTFNVAPYEADLIVDNVAGGVYSARFQAKCNFALQDENAPYCGIAYDIGTPQYAPPSNSLVIAYGIVSGRGVVDPLYPGPGYTRDQGPVYPGGYELDSLTEFSTFPASPGTVVTTTVPIQISSFSWGWDVIGIVIVPG